MPFSDRRSSSVGYFVPSGWPRVASAYDTVSPLWCSYWPVSPTLTVVDIVFALPSTLTFCPFE